MDHIISSPYNRAILTVQELANRLQKKIMIEEDLKERVFSIDKNQITESKLVDLLIRSFSEPTYSLQGAESNQECQNRGIRSLINILHKYKGEKIVIASHGMMITSLLNYFNPIFDLDFLLKMNKPAVFSVEV
ncbi:histidine phosphatase family protein [Bacillus sp. B1-b2]|uniref:histidine phosphatase family protein n=1 Tax=Bacillus sp. B1-b2 TaxID=2653201 RepID=UPI00126199B1|nr:histidine phosphatase family protein [Bacillus sp. B1-b2]KAB7671279.1 histidine phosphatase family protein [Bacillus sp. B1-b2]